MVEKNLIQLPQNEIQSVDKVCLLNELMCIINKKYTSAYFYVTIK